MGCDTSRENAERFFYAFRFGSELPDQTVTYMNNLVETVQADAQKRGIAALQGFVSANIRTENFDKFIEAAEESGYTIFRLEKCTGK